MTEPNLVNEQALLLAWLLSGPGEDWASMLWVRGTRLGDAAPVSWDS